MDLVGKTIGRYRVTRLLGEGGMGRVYLATDGVLGRKVALKILRDDLGLSKDARAHLDARLRIEARAIAAVSHPNVLVLHDMGDDPDVGLYLVLEHVAGESLRARLAEGPLTLDDVARLAIELGSALDAAHDARVLHRDVKPENVFLAPFGSKIGDFGIARVADVSVTRTGMGVVGTPAYAAPEALRGTGDAVDTRSDQFSLAATLYEAVAGERAFPGEDLLAVAAQIGSDTPRPIVRADLPSRAAEELHRVLALRGMAKDPAARYRSCTELGEAVSAALGGLARVSASGSGTPAAPRMRNVALALVLLAMLVLFLVARAARSPVSAPLDAALPTGPVPEATASSPPAKPKPHPTRTAPRASSSSVPPPSSGTPLPPSDAAAELPELPEP